MRTEYQVILHASVCIVGGLAMSSMDDDPWCVASAAPSESAGPVKQKRVPGELVSDMSGLRRNCVEQCQDTMHKHFPDLYDNIRKSAQAFAEYDYSAMFAGSMSSYTVYKEPSCTVFAEVSMCVCAVHMYACAILSNSTRCCCICSTV